MLSGESVYVLYTLLLTNNSQIKVWWILEFSESILLVMTMLLKIWVISSIVNPQKKYGWKVQTLNFPKHQTKPSNSSSLQRYSYLKLETFSQNLENFESILIVMLQMTKIRLVCSIVNPQKNMVEKFSVWSFQNTKQNVLTLSELENPAMWSRRYFGNFWIHPHRDATDDQNSIGM